MWRWKSLSFLYEESILATLHFSFPLPSSDSVSSLPTSHFPLSSDFSVFHFLNLSSPFVHSSSVIFKQCYKLQKEAFNCISQMTYMLWLKKKKKSRVVKYELSLRRHAYSNTLKILLQKKKKKKKKWKFSDKKSDIFHISAQKIDSMFFSRNKKNSVYPCKPQFYYIKVGFKGIKII